MNQTLFMPSEDGGDFAVRVADALIEAKKAAQQRGETLLRSGVIAIIRAIDAERASLASPVTARPDSDKPSFKVGKSTDEDFLVWLEAQECYAHIDVRRELGKAQVWAAGKNQKVSRQRFINWLNKAEGTIGYDGRGRSSSDKKKREVEPRKVYSEANPPAGSAWRYAVRYELTIDLQGSSLDDLCATDWPDLPWRVKEIILNHLNR